MSRDDKNILWQRLSRYREIAEARLVSLGFAKQGRFWKIDRYVRLTGDLSLQVEVPSDFPITLPKVFLNTSQLTRRLPHVEPSGKICYITESNILVDASKPDQIIDECLDMVVVVVNDGQAGKIDEDLITELSAYWSKDSTGQLIVIEPLARNDRVRKLSLLTIDQSKNTFFNKSALLVSESDQSGHDWLKKIGANYSNCVTGTSAFYLPLNKIITLPHEPGSMTYEWIRQQINDRVSTEAFKEFSLWERDQKIKIRVVLLSFPGNVTGESIYCAFSLDDSYREMKTKILKTCPPHKLQSTTSRLNEQYKLSMKPLEVLRMDPEFMIERGGGVVPLHSKSIAIVGCGAVGSHIAERLAILGIGKLLLIDSDKLTADNIHRHVLGASDVGRLKVDALKSKLNLRFPSILIETVSKRIQLALEDKSDLIDSFDLVIFATGEETLERELSHLYVKTKVSLHAWTEAFGVGYHVLVRGNIAFPGCFNCLYGDSDRYSNRASFFEPGQDFKRTMAGCAGAFTLFSGLVVSRLADDTVEQAIDVLCGGNSNRLLSVFLSSKAALEANFKLSERVKLFTPRESKSVNNFFSCNCGSCRTTNEV